MKTRVLSAIVLLPLLLAVFYGGMALKIAGVCISVIGLKEFYNSFKSIDIIPSYLIGLISCFTLYFINILNLDYKFYLFWFFVNTILVLLYVLFTKKLRLTDSAITILGIFYVVFLAFHVILIDGITELRFFIWLVFITAFITDTAAYFTGYFFGKNKLWPEISPKKPIEGAIGGIIGSVIVSGVFGYFVAGDLLIHFIILGFLGSIAGEFGDLTASAIKRKVNIKDFGTLIPGHGGILDRFDSVLFTAPIIYYYIIFIIMI